MTAILNVISGLALILSLFSFLASKENRTAVDTAAGRFLEQAGNSIKQHLAAVLAAIGLGAAKLFHLVADAAPVASRIVVSQRSSLPEGIGDLAVSVLWVPLAVCSGLMIYLLFLWLLQLTCGLLVRHEKGVVGGTQALVALIAQSLKMIA